MINAEINNDSKLYLKLLVNLAQVGIICLIIMSCDEKGIVPGVNVGSLKSVKWFSDLDNFQEPFRTDEYVYNEERLLTEINSEWNGQNATIKYQYNDNGQLEMRIVEGYLLESMPDSTRYSYLGSMVTYINNNEEITIHFSEGKPITEIIMLPGNYTIVNNYTYNSNKIDKTIIYNLENTQDTSVHFLFLDNKKNPFNQFSQFGFAIPKMSYWSQPYCESNVIQAEICPQLDFTCFNIDYRYSYNDQNLPQTIIDPGTTFSTIIRMEYYQ